MSLFLYRKGRGVDEGRKINRMKTEEGTRSTTEECEATGACIGKDGEGIIKKTVRIFIPVLSICTKVNITWMPCGGGTGKR